MTPIANVAAIALVGLLAACVVAEAPPPQTPQSAATRALPAPDRAGAQALLSADETLQVVDFPLQGSTTVTGSVVGYTSTAYAVPVAAGQELTVAFVPSNTNLYMNVHDTRDQSGAAVHRGEFDGPTAVLRPSSDLTYLIRPYQPRATARRNERGTYEIRLTRN